jgi:hypothetical protein
MVATLQVRATGIDVVIRQRFEHGRQFGNLSGFRTAGIDTEAMLHAFSNIARIAIRVASLSGRYQGIYLRSWKANAGSQDGAAVAVPR